MEISEQDLQIVQSDNFFPKIIEKIVMQKFLSDKNNWTYLKSVTNADHYFKKWEKFSNIQETDAFTCQLKEEDEFYKVFESNLKAAALQKFQVTINKLLRVMFVHIPANPSYKDGYHLVPHVDRFTEHKNILYYVNDNDAETIFYNQKYVEDEKIDYSKQTVIRRICPKQNSAIYFDGLQFHSGNVSKYSKRFTINVNFV